MDKFKPGIFGLSSHRIAQSIDDPVTAHVFAHACRLVRPAFGGVRLAAANKPQETA